MNTLQSDRTRSPGLAALGWIGVAASALLLWWALRDVELASVADRLGDTSIPWLLAAVGCSVAMYPLRAWRWRSAIAGVAELPLREAYHGLAIGNMANNLLPARLGEFAAPWVVSRQTDIALATAGSSVVLLRLLDAAAVLVLAMVGLIIGPAELTSDVGALPLWMVAIVAGAILAAILGVLAVLTARPERALGLLQRWVTPRLPARIADAVGGLTESALHGLECLRRRTSFLSVCGQSLLVWIAAAGAFGFGFRAFGLNVHWTAGLLVLAVNTFAILLPSTPGFFGVFEAATRVGLSIFAVPGPAAGEVGLPLHLIVFFAVAIVLGLVSMARVSVSFADLRASERGTR